MIDLIKQCPKCGGMDVVGPKYTKTGCGEHLAYRCMTCGYNMKEPTKDATERNSLDDYKKALELARKFIKKEQKEPKLEVRWTRGTRLFNQAKLGNRNEHW